MQSLSNAYLEIIKFCISVKTAFQKARKSGSYSYIYSTDFIIVLYTDKQLKGLTRRYSLEYYEDLSSSNFKYL